MVLVGGVKHDPCLPHGQIMRKRLTIRGSFMFSAQTVEPVWQLVRSGLIDLRTISVTEVSLEHPSEAIATAAATSGLDIVALRPNGGPDATPDGCAIRA